MVHMSYLIYWSTGRRVITLQSVTKGYLAVLAAAFFWGSQGVIGKKVMLVGFDPLALATYRMTFTFLIFLVGIGVFQPQRLKIKVEDIPFFLFFGLIGVGLFHFCFNYAIYYVGVSTAIMLVYTAPAFVAIISALFLKEPLTINKIIAIVLTLIGCVAISWSNGDSLSFHWLGIIFGLLTGLSYALWNVMCKKAVSKYSPLTVNLYSMGAGSLFLLLMAAPQKVLAVGWQPKIFLVIALMALANTVLPDSLYAYGMKFLEASKASILANAELLIAVILASIFLNEPVAGFKLLGFFAILVAIGLLVREDFKPCKSQVESGFDV
jgi:DME family drug/metabolite transporter